FTHEHADQCHGIDDLRALVIRHRRQMPVYMDERTASVLMHRFEYCFEGKGGYPPILDARIALQPGARALIDGKGGPLPIDVLLQDHGSIPSLGFRLGDLAYCNDVKALPEQSLAALEGVETLIVDALRYSKHPTHASVDDALGWIERLKPNRAILTNLHVDLDYARLRAELPDHVVPAFDGMEIRSRL
ncbi:MAG: MBL fold metallo-hydrolase, partial [Pseudomonadota bacterium]